jgi:anti-sigma factor RsiW
MKDNQDYYSAMETDREFERFELLSAYMDDEVTDGERQQVEQWLAEDSVFAAKYEQLKSLNQSWQNIPVPTNNVSHQELANRVFKTIDQRRQKRFKVIIGGAIVAGLTAIISGVSGLWGNNFTPQVAKVSTPVVESITTVLTNVPEPVAQPLMVSINDPIIKIRKPARNRRSTIPEVNGEG